MTNVLEEILEVAKEKFLDKGACPYFIAKYGIGDEPDGSQHLVGLFEYQTICAKKLGHVEWKLDRKMPPWEDQWVILTREELGFTVVKQQRGEEGGPRDCYCIFEWKGKTYRVVYSYSSYDGCSYCGAEPVEVKPVEKTVTVYEPIKKGH